MAEKKSITNLRERVSYFFEGLNVWEVNSRGKLPYQIGVTLDQKDASINGQVAVVTNRARNVAEKSGLEACIGSPSPASGGNSVMYVCFVYPYSKKQ